MIRNKGYNALLRALGIDEIYGVDYETYWDSKYTLKSIPATEYVYDDRFEVHVASVMKDTWSKPKVMEVDELRAFFRGVNWKRAGLLAHNTSFDGLITHRHFGVQPARLFDTLSMARPIMPVTVGGSLVKLCGAFGREAKKHGSVLGNTRGKRWAEFTKEEKQYMKQYAGDDIADCWFLFDKLSPYLPIDEMKLIDVTLKMFCRPRVLFDKAGVTAVIDEERKVLENLMQYLQSDKTVLRSADKFADLLRTLGVEPPTKVNKNNETTYAFARTDEDFKELLEHEDQRVVAAVSARLGAMSTSTSTRAQRFLKRADYGPQPVFLNYAGAKTLRWSGGDKMNWQNLKRGSALRKTIKAPPGHSFIIADSSQIEARTVAWFNGQQNIVDAFAADKDVYAVAATDIYGRPINKYDNPEERFVGKVAVLSLGYQAGGPRFASTLRLGLMGPPVSITDKQAVDIVKAWRQNNPHIVAGWKRVMNNARSAFGGKQLIHDGPVSFEGAEGRGIIHLPGGMYMRFDRIQFDDEGMSYAAKFRMTEKGPSEKRVRLYGGIIMENIIQALARRVVAEQFLAALDKAPWAQLCMSSHDEGVFVVPDRQAVKTRDIVRAAMKTAPSWAPGLPVSCEIHISKEYNK